jgi:hypothetical protein
MIIEEKKRKITAAIAEGGTYSLSLWQRQEPSVTFPKQISFSDSHSRSNATKRTSPLDTMSKTVNWKE